MSFEPTSNPPAALESDATKARVEMSEEAFFRVFTEGDLESVKECVKQFEAQNIDCLSRRDAIGYTPLHYACFYGKLEIAKYLLEEKKVRTDIKTNQDFSGFDLACSQGHVSIVQYFDDSGRLETSEIQEGFQCALVRNKTSVVDYLWDKVSSEFKVNAYPPLFKVQVNSMQESLALLWNKYSAEERILLMENAFKSSNLDLLKKFTKFIFTFKNFVISLFEHADLQCVKFFVEKFNIDINKPISSCYNSTFFSRACSNPHVDVVRYLCEERNADLLVFGGAGYDGFLRACAVGCREVVQYLHENRKADPKKIYRITSDSSDFMTTPLIEAAKAGKFDTVEYLAEVCSVDLYFRDMERKGLNALQYASWLGHLAVVKYLCGKMGTRIYETNVDDLHALHYAAIGNHTQVVTYLCEKMGDRVHDMTKIGHVWHIACQLGHLAVVKCLYEFIYRTSPLFDFQTVRRKDEKTALQLACELGHRDVAQFLFEKLFNNLILAEKFGGLEYAKCHDKVKPIYLIFYLLKSLGVVADEMICCDLTRVMQCDVQMLDSILLRNVFCGSSTERVYELNDDQKSQFIRCLLALSPQQELPLSPQLELRRDVWTRFVQTCLDAFNHPQNSDAVKRVALYRAVLFLDALMTHYPENNLNQEGQLTVVLKLLLHKQESKETLLAMTQNYPAPMRKLIDEMSDYFIAHKMIKPNVRVLSKLYDSCYADELSQLQAESIAKILALQAENARLAAKVAEYEGSNDKKRSRDEVDEQKQEDATNTSVKKQGRFMLLGSSEEQSRHDDNSDAFFSQKPQFRENP